ncbi:hypothetical protein [Bradyrhizobium diazoefficiens]|jgi:hypothetical protein|uniref:hypothetical protein n=1 Tax=Bradyrhizobium diazoefficiens TaxID=1355477 RepID=UPI0027152E8F|nr:hypothetical protein [Bradyrhizobium diazoefficiens]WLB34849.1 hypothetical protein QIH78_25545 [Bradyrhizobium diazoefficiens]BCF44582.1 hypothetical protein XF16B_50720 [Bradyrhizobium diazoefficiens]BCF70728.1 hypothetical protein XF19B_50810 [Bradyrhizobium diazoefficiens]
MALALLVTLIGVPITIYVAYDKFNSATNAHDSAQCIARRARSGYTFKKKYPDFSEQLDYAATGCPRTYVWDYWALTDVMALADLPAPTFMTSDASSALGIGFLVTGVLAVVAYLGFWLIGWLCAGFTRDS